MAPKKRTTRLNPETTTTTPTTTSVTNAQLKAMIDQGVTTALAAHDANTNGVDSHNSGMGVRRNERGTRNALTWWNFHVRTVGNDVAYAMTWTELKKKMTSKYCPRTEIKKLKVELMFLEESDKIKRYVGGLPNMIHGNSVMSDSDESGITYTEVSSPYEDLSDIGSPRADDHDVQSIADDETVAEDNPMKKTIEDPAEDRLIDNPADGGDDVEYEMEHRAERNEDMDSIRRQMMRNE
ncbi:hypothetical protein Tco_0169256 [Tanacetum coccineum]